MQAQLAVRDRTVNSHNFFELVMFGITDYVHEQNVRNREMRVRFHFNSQLRLDSVAPK